MPCLQQIEALPVAKHTMQVVVTDPKRLTKDLRDVYIRGTLDGVDFMGRPGGLSGGRRRPAPRLSASAIVRYAIHLGAEASRRVQQPSIVALPEKAGTTDADRLKAARGDMTRQECATAAGLKDESSVRNVETRGMRLAGKLLVWVEAQESGR